VGPPSRHRSSSRVRQRSERVLPYLNAPGSDSDDSSTSIPHFRPPYGGQTHKSTFRRQIKHSGPLLGRNVREGDEPQSSEERRDGTDLRREYPAVHGRQSRSTAALGAHSGGVIPSGGKYSDESDPYIPQCQTSDEPRGRTNQRGGSHTNGGPRSHFTDPGGPRSLFTDPGGRTRYKNPPRAINGPISRYTDASRGVGTDPWGSPSRGEDVPRHAPARKGGTYAYGLSHWANLQSTTEGEFIRQRDW
jgi:hypothetical protein